MAFWRSLQTCTLAATVLVVALVGAPPVQAATGASDRRVALIIGNDTYTHLPALNNARKDAEDMAVKLRELGFETILKVNAGRREMARSLRDFEGRLSSGATGLAFFAGHGIQSDGKNYLIPADGFIEVEADLDAEAMTAQHVLAAMERAGNPLNIVILDACRDNPLPKRTRSARRGLTVVGIPAGAKGTAILYAAGEGQTAEDGPRGGNGVFTGELLRVLDEPGLSLEQVFKRVNRRVQRRTNDRQRPWSLVSLQGDFVFRDGESEVATPRSSGGTTAEVAFWQSAEKSGKREDYEAYRRAFPEGVFAPLAETRLASLGEPSAPTFEIEELDATHVVLKTANLRAGPSTSAEKVGLAAKDDELVVTGRVKDRNWLRVVNAGRVAFIFAPLAREVDPTELTEWQKLGRNPTREQLQGYLENFGDGHFATRGRTLLAALIPSKPEYAVTALSKVMQVDAGGVVIRVEPDGSADEVGRLSAGESAEITGKVIGRQWYRVVIAGGRGGFAFGAALVEQMKAEAPAHTLKQRSVGDVFKDCNECPEMVVVPAGEFVMGSNDGEDDEKPIHRVVIPSGLAVGRFEITFSEWDACVSGGGCGGHRPVDSGWGRGRRPVINVSWDVAKRYITWLTGKTGESYRLLSESEWEYVARAGTTTKYHTGNTIGYSQANYSGGGGGETVPVGRYGSNAFGLHDVHGNVWEWVEDCWDDSYGGAPGGGEARTTGECTLRVVRGGSWNYAPRLLRSASRSRFWTSFRSIYLGFRVARMVSQ
jgi:formylglycine-generating enzyme required for sulfatase activity